MPKEIDLGKSLDKAMEQFQAAEKVLEEAKHTHAMAKGQVIAIQTLIQQANEPVPTEANGAATPITVGNRAGRRRAAKVAPPPVQ